MTKRIGNIDPDSVWISNREALHATEAERVVLNLHDEPGAELLVPHPATRELVIVIGTQPSDTIPEAPQVDTRGLARLMIKRFEITHIAHFRHGQCISLEMKHNYPDTYWGVCGVPEWARNAHKLTLRNIVVRAEELDGPLYKVHLAGDAYIRLPPPGYDDPKGNLLRAAHELKITRLVLDECWVTTEMNREVIALALAAQCVEYAAGSPTTNTEVEVAKTLLEEQTHTSTVDWGSR